MCLTSNERYLPGGLIRSQVMMKKECVLYNYTNSYVTRPKFFPSLDAGRYLYNKHHLEIVKRADSPHTKA